MCKSKIKGEELKMFNDYQDEKNEYSETKYLNEELTGVKCKVLKYL